MKWFWYSLIGFCVLMCSCKTKKVDSNVKVRNDIQSELSYFDKSVKIDTSKTAYFATETQSIVIEEDITVTEYDKESGKPIKETKAKRKTTQDSDKVVSEKESKGESEVRNDSLNHFVDKHDMAESETEEESKGGQEAFGQWLGIVFGVGIVLGLFFLILYLWRKFKK